MATSEAIGDAFERGASDWRDGGWKNGLREAVDRLSHHLVTDRGGAGIRFDARDRQALAFVLGYLEKTKRQAREIESHTSICSTPGCGLPTLRPPGSACATCEP